MSLNLHHLSRSTFRGILLSLVCLYALLTLDMDEKGVSAHVFALSIVAREHPMSGVLTKTRNVEVFTPLTHRLVSSRSTNWGSLEDSDQ